MKNLKKILVIDDEKDMIRLVRYNLPKEKYKIFSAGSCEVGLKLLKKVNPDMILLDIMLPKMNGLDFLREIRADGHKTTPVIILSGKRKESDRILGLKLQADDYMVKPYSLGELEARIEGIFRRLEAASGESAPRKPLNLGEIQIDIERHQITVKGKRANLAPKEFSILQCLVEANGKVLSREQILETVWGYEKDVDIDTRTVDQHVARLRFKLRPEDRLIRTVPNFGYQIMMP